ncbi:hypothetical protein LVQ78_05830 [Buttiauxella sp. A2-C2_NF]|uniref:hypothetical protein n=1 Tax=Buttiauxella ferragutiae TaxID=82989 RepID=UPI001E611954|nr:hypothetical protein [Buttiauxella ferragutiae]MCE0825549.1 hypothetical protein [Buttiauxella ferragutiae]
MSKLPVIPSKLKYQTLSHIEATPNGIRFDSRIIGYSGVIRQLEAGGFDSSLANGLLVVAEIQLADTNNWFSPSDEQMAIIWRWLIACIFIHEQQDKNGMVMVESEDGSTSRAVLYAGEHGGIAIYPSTERCSLATHIEGIAIQKYGAEAGLQRAIQLYQGMAESDPDGNALRLSQWGREGLTMLHDDFIKMLNTEGIPAAPVAH